LLSDSYLVNTPPAKALNDRITFLTFTAEYLSHLVE